jgi:hypothetical protein
MRLEVVVRLEVVARSSVGAQKDDGGQSVGQNSKAQVIRQPLRAIPSHRPPANAVPFSPCWTVETSSWPRPGRSGGSRKSQCSGRGGQGHSNGPDRNGRVIFTITS